MNKNIAVAIIDLDGTISESGPAGIFYHTEPQNYEAVAASCQHNRFKGEIYEQILRRIESHWTKLQQVTSPDGQKYYSSFLPTSKKIIAVTARGDVHRYKENTKKWFELHKIKLDDLFMREKFDTRPDYIVKGEMLEGIINKYGEIRCAFDDREDVLEEFHRLGVPNLYAVVGDDMGIYIPKEKRTGKELFEQSVMPSLSPGLGMPLYNWYAPSGTLNGGSGARPGTLSLKYGQTGNGIISGAGVGKFNAGNATITIIKHRGAGGLSGSTLSGVVVDEVDDET